MRVSTAFNRLLQIPGATVTEVAIGQRDIEVSLRPRARLLRCPCGKRAKSVYDRRRRRWRHLDLARCRLWLVYDIRRLHCPDCGVVTEELPWARPGARHTRDFEDTVLWLAQRTDRTSVATLMRCAWETVTAIISRGVAELLDNRRLQELYREDKRALVNQVARAHRRIGRAWALKEQARDLYRYDHEPGVARQLLKAWITAAKRSRIPSFVALGKRFAQHFEPILAAIELGISNALIEGINAKIRLINARGYGHHSAQTLTSMIYLCLGGLQVNLPTRT